MAAFAEALRQTVADQAERRAGDYQGEARKAERRQKAIQEEDRPAGPAPKVRTSANTCDLRGQRVDDDRRRR